MAKISKQITVPKNLKISAFFPCYNDAGTIASIVELAVLTLKKYCISYEVIVVDDGSSDNSREILRELAKKESSLRLVFHKKNLGYGGALISGFRNCRLDYIFYTDGDFQYDVSELRMLISNLRENIDIIQGYKIKRHDPWYRIFIGDIYNFAVKLAFNIKIRDVDCDFRLIRRAIFNKVKLTKLSGVITVEMIKKIQDEGFRFYEVPVTHYFRSYGKSQFFNFARIGRVFFEIVRLWQELVLIKWQRKLSSEVKTY